MQRFIIIEVGFLVNQIEDFLTPNLVIIFRDFFPPYGGVVMPRAYKPFLLIEYRDDELSRSSNGIIESGQCNNLALH